MQVQTQETDVTTTEPRYFLDGISFDNGDVNIRTLFDSDAAYQVAKFAIETKVTTLTTNYATRIDELQREYEEQIAKLISENNEISDKLAQSKTELSNAKLEIEDISAKRDAAAAELASAKAEIERLNDHVTEIAIGAKAATKVVDTNLNTNLAEAMEKLKSTRPAIYDVQPLDNRGANYKAKLAETDEEITFNYLEKGKYREVTAQEAEQFRRAAEEQKRANEDLAQPGGVEKADVVELPTQFQTEEDTANGVAEGNMGGQVAAKTIEERLTALELKVFGKGEVA
ncbi:hypothetical protein [Paenibacillus polymyxa]|uniref:hypothetical protein n=1 Tax=Paenibacillus polymyxa TaxID=1406 RepID=UPI002379FD08|nr:hypothetical protein [Paenibacillus polymyxa]WDM22633.1 hypothetical protein J4I02_03155 [Paenibacillus polymyxa]